MFGIGTARDCLAARIGALEEQLRSAESKNRKLEKSVEELRRGKGCAEVDCDALRNELRKLRAAHPEPLKTYRVGTESHGERNVKAHSYCSGNGTMDFYVGGYRVAMFGAVNYIIEEQEA